MLFISQLFFLTLVFFRLQLAVASNNNSAALAVEANAAKVQEAAQRTTNNHSVYKLQDESEQSVFPGSVLRAGNDLYFLSPNCLWWCLGAKTQVSGGDILILRQINPPAAGGLSISWQEANDFAYLPQRQAIVVLDKSGDLFEYSLLGPAEKRWRVLRSNGSNLGPPDPDYIALCEKNNSIVLLDPERNQLWLQSPNSNNLEPLSTGVLSWKLRAHDVNLTDGIGVVCCDERIYVLRRNGSISKYGIKSGARQYHHKTVNNMFCSPLGQVYFKHNSRLRPTRLYINSQGDIYMVERENNRVLKISDKQTACNSFTFPGASDLRGLVLVVDGFWIVNGDKLIYRGNKSEEAESSKVNARTIDRRLQEFILPIAGQALPGHPGVYPGARRLYRFGVHAGLDMFDQPGSRTRVITGTPVRAACAGEIARIDLAYKDMNYTTYNKVIRECFLAHQTSAKNEDLLRGCQVWIDSGNGLVTKYAHLVQANHNLHVSMNVKQGDIIGNVGVSGTGENLPGHARYPHLHFEIWLDGKYLGYGLTPAETMSLFEDVFISHKR